MRLVTILLTTTLLTACGFNASVQVADQPPATTTTQAPPPPTINDVAAESTVHIHAGPYRGSGVYVGNRRVLTAAHVCADMKKKVKAQVKSTKKKEVISIVEVYMDNRYPGVDLCLVVLERDPTDLKALPIAKSNAQIGETIYLSSYAGGANYSFAEGKLIGEGVVSVGLVLVEVCGSSIRALPGFSGGPVLNTNGELIGIMVLYNMNTFDTFFEPVTDIRSFIEEQLKIKGL